MALTRSLLAVKESGRAPGLQHARPGGSKPDPIPAAGYAPKVHEEAQDARRWCETINLKIMSVVLAAGPDVGVAL